jgi:hypothetical protein
MLQCLSKTRRLRVMIGVDLSLRPIVWAAPYGERWLTGELPDGPQAADTLIQALQQHQVRERELGLCLPTPQVTTGVIPGQVTGRRARHAARLAAASALRTTPREVVLIAEATADGLGYAAAERLVIRRTMAPWEQAHFRVRVVEPAATALLRAMGTDTVEILIRTGRGAIEIVAGSRRSLVLVRHLALHWEDQEAHMVALELESTRTLLRERGIDSDTVYVGGAGPVDVLRASLARSLTVRPLALHAGYGVAPPPDAAFLAASVALWNAPGAGQSRRAHPWWPRIGGIRAKLRRRRGAARKAA